MIMYAWYRALNYYIGNVGRTDLDALHGLSVRCIRD